jgi:anti-sigma B factor antagonist
VQRVRDLLDKITSEETERVAHVRRLEQEKNELSGQIDLYLGDIQRLQAEIARGGRDIPPVMPVDPGITTTFAVHDEGGIQVIVPSGDLGEAEAESFRTLLLNLFDRGNTRFRFDLSRVAAIDSIPFSVFLVFAKMLLKSGPSPDLHIVGASSDIAQLFRLTRMDRVFRLGT